ncbi:MAG: pantoate--beta-alanine ligase [bacterium]|nr:pantoate--beta-alanine ligase [bacterium]
MENIPIFRTPDEMRAWSHEKHNQGKVIGCVPTMGALHEGHLSLIRACAKDCGETIVTIFVNPIQFAPDEDFEKYPRNEKEDLSLAFGAGATAAYCPSVATMYGGDPSVFVIEEKMTKCLDGLSRPNHFRGVLTVVAKLFNATNPDRAYFGLKDYQQILLIKQMVHDLDFPVEITGCPIIREPDGLAMSSRNRYLLSAERKDALCLSKAIDAVTKMFNNGERQTRNLEWLARTIIESASTSKIDYISTRDAEDLSPVKDIEKPTLFALAIYIGTTRLIDNTVLTPVKEEQ